MLKKYNVIMNNNSPFLLKLINTSLYYTVVVSINGKYQITSLGEIVLNAKAKVETAIKYYWELKAIDSIISRYRELPPKECQHIIDNIIDNDEIKEMLVSKNSFNKSTFTALANTAYQQTH